jgi:hypothetical protein
MVIRSINWSVDPSLELRLERGVGDRLIKASDSGCGGIVEVNGITGNPRASTGRASASLECGERIGGPWSLMKGHGNVPDLSAHFYWDSPPSAALVPKHNVPRHESSALGLGSYDDRTIFGTIPNDFPGFIRDDKEFASRVRHAAALRCSRRRGR